MRRCSPCPIAAGFPQVLVYLALAGALAAALAALAASLMATAAILSEDVVHGLQPETAPDSARIAHRARRAAGCRLRDRLARHRGARPIRCKLFLWSLTFSAVGSPSRCLCCRSGGSASMPGGRWPACWPGSRRRRSPCCWAKPAHGRCRARWPAPSACPPGPPPPMVASLLTPAPGTQRARQRARDARARRRDAV